MIGKPLLVLKPRLWPIAILVAGLTCLFPAIDLWSSGLFYRTADIAWVQRSDLMQFARSGVPPLIIGTLLFVTVLGIAGRIWNEMFWDISGRKVGFLIGSLILGPGLVVESILKTFSGRARPRDVTQFGGDDPFTPALRLADACERNCSFVSGHAALAFWATAFAFLMPTEHRVPVFVAGLALGFLMGIARMAEGAHFLSDVIFAGLIVVGINVWLGSRMLGEAQSTEASTVTTNGA